jgi:hypothetical protein
MKTTIKFLVAALPLLLFLASCDRTEVNLAFTDKPKDAPQYTVKPDPNGGVKQIN